MTTSPETLRRSGRSPGGSLGWGLVVVLVGSGLFFAYGASLLSARRDLLLGAAVADAGKVAASVASLVRARANDIRGDLAVAAEVLSHPPDGAADTKTLVRSQLIALDRAHRHYTRLWHFLGDETLSEVSGNRPSDQVAPSIPTAALRSAALAARQNPGDIVRRRVAGQPYLRVFAYTPPAEGDHVLAVLVSLEALFETLQKRARFPGADLWVVDADGSMLVDPTDGQGDPRVVEKLSGDAPSGSSIIGLPPTLWPFGTGADGSALLAWKSHEGRTLRWTAGVSVALRDVQGELKSLALELLLLGMLMLAALLVIGFVSYQRHRSLSQELKTLQDISSLREQLIAAEKLSSFGQIAAGVAHEIGTPLGAISIRLDRLRETAASPEVSDSVRVMKDQIERITRIMQNLLEYARPSRAEVSPQNLLRAAREVLALLDYRFQKGGVTATLSIPEDLTVEASQDQLHQVLLNLVVNACDACPPGAEISLSAEAFGESAKLTVADTGPGVPQEARARIFDPFFSTKGSEGTGLGLSIVTEIVKNHGGSITLEESDSGACFVILWPTR